MPAVLGGGINMSNSVSASKDALQGLSTENAKLERAISNTFSITEEEVTFSDQSSLNSRSSDTFIDNMLAMVGISPSHAAGKEEGTSQSYSPSVQFTIQAAPATYALSLYRSKNRDAVEQKQADYERKGVSNLVIRQAGGYYYLVTRDMNRTDSLIEAIKIQKKLNVTPTLLRTNKE